VNKSSLLHFADLHTGVENYGRLDPATGIGGTPPAGVRRCTTMREMRG